MTALEERGISTAQTRRRYKRSNLYYRRRKRGDSTLKSCTHELAQERRAANGVGVDRHASRERYDVGAVSPIVRMTPVASSAPQKTQHEHGRWTLIAGEREESPTHSPLPPKVLLYLPGKKAEILCMLVHN